jgi:hypothetical protein
MSGNNDLRIGSRDVAVAAIRIASTNSLEEEKKEIAIMKERGIRVAAVNFGGEFSTMVGKIIERTVVAAKREGVIAESHPEEGAVAGAAHEAISQMFNKALGWNVGGKISIARFDEHISVAIFFGVGLLHLNDVAIGLGHRVV